MLVVPDRDQGCFSLAESCLRKGLNHGCRARAEQESEGGQRSCRETNTNGNRSSGGMHSHGEQNARGVEMTSDALTLNAGPVKAGANHW